MAISPLQIPGYSQAPDINWTSLSELGKTLQENRVSNQRREAMSLASLGQSGTPDYAKTVGTLAQLGDLEGASKIAAIQKAIAPETSADMQAYNLYTRQGGTAPFLDFKKELAQAGATRINNTTNVSNVGEKEYDKQSAKDFAELNRKMIEGSQSARTKTATLSRLDQLLSDPTIYTGAGANQVLAAKKLAKAAGFDVGDVSGPEAIKAIGNQFALELRNPAGGAGMPGALSDKDREFLQASVPGLEQTPEGNRRIVDYMKRVAQRSIDIERQRQDYVKKNRRLDEGFYREIEKYSEANPLFPEADRQRQSAPQRRSQMAPQDIDASLSNARAAITRNPAVRDAVIQRLRENGIDTGGL